MLRRCNSSVLVPKANGKVPVFLDPARLNKVLIRPVHRGPTLNDILLRLVGFIYIIHIDVSSGSHSLKLYEQSSYLTIIFFGPSGKYRYKQLPFGVEPTGDMFQRKIDKTFNAVLNILGIADNILITGFGELGRP